MGTLHITITCTRYFTYHHYNVNTSQMKYTASNVYFWRNKIEYWTAPQNADDPNYGFVLNVSRSQTTIPVYKNIKIPLGEVESGHDVVWRIVRGNHPTDAFFGMPREKFDAKVKELQIPPRRPRPYGLTRATSLDIYHQMDYTAANIHDWKNKIEYWTAPADDNPNYGFILNAFSSQFDPVYKEVSIPLDEVDLESCRSFMFSRIKSRKRSPKVPRYNSY